MVLLIVSRVSFDLSRKIKEGSARRVLFTFLRLSITAEAEQCSVGLLKEKIGLVLSNEGLLNRLN